MSVTDQAYPVHPAPHTLRAALAYAVRHIGTPESNRAMQAITEAHRAASRERYDRLIAESRETATRARAIADAGSVRPVMTNAIAGPQTGRGVK